MISKEYQAWVRIFARYGWYGADGALRLLSINTVTVFIESMIAIYRVTGYIAYGQNSPYFL
jgi:hypothetical protein